jgi:trehalose-6-phosphate hydrolase
VNIGQRKDQCTTSGGTGLFCISERYYFDILCKEGKTPEEALHIIGERSRDNGRTPMQWDASEGAGFTTGKPWLCIPANHVTINAKTEAEDPESILAFYKELVRLRKEMEIIADGQIRFIESGQDSILAYERTLENEKLTVYCSVSGEELALAEPVSLEGKEILLSSYLDQPAGPVASLRPFEAIAVYEK